ncbi:hypothetical protein KA005_43155, partial [bacterium]|nr:hypothetical protein [bacterium]
GNPRYQPKQMKEIFGYDNLFFEMAMVEIATMLTLGDIGKIPKKVMEELTSDVITQLVTISTTEVDKIEKEVTKHDVRAWVRRAQEIIKGKLSQWVHIPLTSYDALDTARTMQFSNAYRIALKPSIAQVVNLFAEIVEKFADQIQIGRTHGQHALPVTVGFWLATILSRIVDNWEQMDRFHKALRGKISGAVGAHNAQIALGFNDARKDISFEELVLKKLNLKPARISTQILPPEPLGYFLFSCCMMSAALAQFGRDGRHLMRSEIGEISESFEQGQVGSSTMPQKRNPINFENLGGTWLKTKNEFGKVLDTLISEHQRDLVNSSVIRDFPIIVINLQHQLNTLLRKNKKGIPFISRISVNEDACMRNFQQSATVILAEPLYIALQMAGYEGDAHELINKKLVAKAKDENLLLVEVLSLEAKKNFSLEQARKRIPKEVWNLLHHPEAYTGDAREKALEVAAHGKKQAKNLLLRRN